MRKIILFVVAFSVTLGVIGIACVPHPVGPARRYGTYQGKAVTTAEGAVSATQTVLLTATAAVSHQL
ncbi:MAG: hypothetical protein QOG03_467, partial [Actinomycetota bacterium]|nr:hypothetical protein [Actinomycetota bacterium]